MSIPKQVVCPFCRALINEPTKDNAGYLHIVGDRQIKGVKWIHVPVWICSARDCRGSLKVKTGSETAFSSMSVLP